MEIVYLILKIKIVKLLLGNEKVLKGDKLLEKEEKEWAFDFEILEELRKGKIRRNEL